MSKVDFIIETYGIEGLEKTFKNLSNMKDKRAIFISAFKKAAQPTVEYLQANLPINEFRKKGKHLREAVGTVAVRGEDAIYIGARKTSPFRAFHGHLVEKGTTERFYITKHGKRKSVGKMKGTWMFRKAKQETEQKAIDAFLPEMDRAVARYIIRTTHKDK